ncbi:MAG: hypothetical protein RQ826_03025 [Xanthomonadales bacterium]|nr:hypothetical protein [Xanthomonadales bacterium]
MPSGTRQGNPGAAILAQAVENVMRRLIRLLVGRMSLVRLQEMIRSIFVEETERKLRAENPGHNVTLTQLALATGLDTRTVVRIRKQTAKGTGRRDEQFLRELTPESAIVEAWAQRVQDSGEEQAVLDYGDEKAGFESLVRKTIATRGITTSSIIQRLVDTRSIERDREHGRLRLLVDHFSPYLSDDEPSILNAAFSAISNLAGTVEHNLDAGLEGEKLFQRQSWTFRLDAEDRAGFRADMREMLEEYEARARNTIKPWEQTDYDPQLMTAGVGFYYFEDR